MRIKKNKKNEYVFTDGIWVRNLCVKNSSNIDINNLFSKEKDLFLENEIENLKNSKLELNEFQYSNVIICSDGFGWEEKQFILGDIPSNQAKILTVNGALSKWKMVGENAPIKRIINFHVVNNPYQDCMNNMPKKHNYYPNLLASTKTNHKFISEYRGDVYFYKSSEELEYSGPPCDIGTKLDDYRNPICAAVSFAYKLGAKKILLFCCDESFEDERPTAIRMDNGLYQYPQQILSQKILDKQFFWLKKTNIEIFDISSGIKYENAQYIFDNNEIKNIFNQ
jgi:hypothetical protein